MEAFTVNLKKFELLLSEMQKGNIRHRALAYHSHYMITIRYSGIVENKEKTSAITEKWLKELPMHSANVSKRQIMDAYLTASIAFFRTGLYERSLEFITRILNEQGSFKIHELYNMALLLSLFIHYELGNIELIEYTSINIKNYLKAKRELYKTENILISFFNKAVKISDIGVLTEELEILKNRLGGLLGNRFEKDVINELNIIGWIDKKLANRTLPYS
jgi:hypothetical protein